MHVKTDGSKYVASKMLPHVTITGLDQQPSAVDAGRFLTRFHHLTSLRTSLMNVPSRTSCNAGHLSRHVFVFTPLYNKQRSR